MTEITFGDISKMKEIAELAVKQNQVQLEDLIGLLKKGVSLPIASRIIDEIWGSGRDSLKIKTRLYSNFPVKNGELISYSQFNQVAKDHFKKLGEPVDIYFINVVNFINDNVDQDMTVLKEKSITDPDVGVKYNEFRKEVMKYVSVLSWGCSTDFRLVNEDVYDKWESIPVPSEIIEQGDYLFLDCFKDRLYKCHSSVILGSERGIGQETTSISAVDWKTDRVKVFIKLTYLFARYIESFHGD